MGARQKMELGWYDFEYDGGTFQVCFRPAGGFFCPEYQAAASWKAEGDTVHIDWQQYGKNQLQKQADNTWAGSTVGKPEDWRKMKQTRALSPMEALLLGDGGGTEWDFIYDGGNFNVQFKADGFNHFKCVKYPAHSHWSVTGESEIFVDWAKFGQYELRVDAAAKAMEGSVKGQPDKWRKTNFIRNIPFEGDRSKEKCEAH